MKRVEIQSLIGLKNKCLVDWYTLGIVVTMCGGMVVTGKLVHSGDLNVIWGVIIGTYLMNLSFTAWHESSHGNFSTNSILNDFIGVISSIFSVYPGYFARRREHLIHHKWEGQSGMDPVFLRIQTNFWIFPFKLVALTTFDRKKNEIQIPNSFFPITKEQQFVDRLSMAIVFFTIVLSVVWGFWWTLLWTWLVPRVLVFFIHAYYICFFPHQLPEGGYRLYRVRQGFLWRIFTADQNFHGIHHKWPFIPWHRYKFAFEHFRPEIDQAEIEVRN